MRLLGILACLVLATVAFAGCSDQPSDDPASSSTSGSPTSASTTSSSSRSTTTSSTSTSSAAAANHPPVGSLSVLVNGTSARFELNGSDADGDALSWTLEFGDGNRTNGTSLPASANHTYASTGNHSATFNLSDGRNTTSYEAVVVVAAQGGGSAPLQSVSGGWAIGVADGGASTEIFACGSSPFNEVTHLRFAVEPATVGRPFTATITDASGGASIQDWGIIFFEAGCLAFEVVSVTGNGPLTGTVPAAAALGAAIATGGAMLELTYAAG